MGVYLGSSGREIRASCNRWHILAPIIFSLIEVGSYFIIITKDSIKRLECLRGQDRGKQIVVSWLVGWRKRV